MRSASKRKMKWIERCFWAIGFLAIAVWCAVWLNARRQQAEGSRELDRRLEAVRSAKPSLKTSLLPRLAPGDLIGRIEIPRLRMSTVVFEGTGDDVLRIGVGHLPGSPLPGDHGNVVLAGHRDTFFRALRNIHEHDAIDVVTPAGTRRYRVDSTAIVAPDHTEVLNATPGAVLTLITCYPFEWFGHAPKRFIVRAREDEHPAPSLASAMPSRSPVQSTISTMRPVIRRPPTPIVREVKSISSPGEVAPAPADGLDGLSATKVVGAQEDLSAPVETESPADTGVVAASGGNRMVRGLKKFNPKRLLAKIAGK
jgi:sortase A